MSGATTTPGTPANETSKRNKHNSTNHSRPYTFESRRGPHYYPNRGSSPPLPTTTASTSPTATTTPSTTKHTSASTSSSTSPSTRTRSPPLDPEEIFQPPSLGEKAKHMYNSSDVPTAGGVAELDSTYANPYMYNYNPAVEQAPFGWDDHGGLVDYSQPGYMDLVEHRKRMILSRSRLVLRVIATVCAIAIVAGLGSAIAVFFSTRDEGLTWNGEPIWHPNIDEKPSTVLLGVGGALAVISFIMLSVSAWQKIRHVSFLSNIVNIIISLVNISLAIFGAAFFVYYKGTTERPTFWNWVCQRGVNDQQVQFSMLCGEAKFSYAMAYIVAVLEILVLVNIIVGWVMLGKNGGRYKGVGRTVVVQVKKAEKKQGQWKASY